MDKQELKVAQLLQRVETLESQVKLLQQTIAILQRERNKPGPTHFRAKVT